MNEPAPELRMFFVCTGNQARSPIAAAWTARALSGLPVRVGSAGTLPGVPRPLLPEARAAADDLGLDLSEYASSHVSEHDLSSVDLVIGFELHHMAAAVVDGGAPAGRAFLLNELVRLALTVPPPPGPVDPLVRARTYVRVADLRRGDGRHVARQEIKDPAGRRRRAFQEIIDEVVRGCGEMTSLLFGV